MPGEREGGKSGNAKMTSIKIPLRITSIIGIILFPITVFMLTFWDFYIYDDSAYLFFVVGNAIMSVYAIAHSIIAIIQGLRHNIKTLKLMGIIGIICYLVCFIVTIIFANYYYTYDIYKSHYTGYMIFSIVGFGYGTVFAIVAIIKHPIQLRTMSIIGIILFPIVIVLFSRNLGDVMSWYDFFLHGGYPCGTVLYLNPSLLIYYLRLVLIILIGFAYAIAHSIIAIIYGSKHNSKILKLMGIIGIIYYLVCFFGTIVFANIYFSAFDPLFNELTDDFVTLFFREYGYITGHIFLIVGFSYGIIFAIVSINKTRMGMMQQQQCHA